MASSSALTNWKLIASSFEKKQSVIIVDKVFAMKLQKNNFSCLFFHAGTVLPLISWKSVDFKLQF